MQRRRSCCAGGRAFGQASAIVGDDGRSPGSALRLEIDVAVQHPERLGLLCSIADSTLTPMPPLNTAVRVVYAELALLHFPDDASCLH
jgi:hypothetical protein